MIKGAGHLTTPADSSGIAVAGSGLQRLGIDEADDRPRAYPVGYRAPLVAALTWSVSAPNTRSTSTTSGTVHVRAFPQASPELRYFSAKALRKRPARRSPRIVWAIVRPLARSLTGTMSPSPSVVTVVVE